MSFRSTPAFPPHRPAAFTLSVVFLAASLLAGCSSSSEDASVDDGYSGPCLELTPAGPPVAGTVTLEASSGSTCDLLEVDVMVTDVSDVFSVNFQLTFDPSVATFDGYSTSGSFLGAAPDLGEFVLNRSPDTVLVSLAQLSRTGADATGTEPVIRLTFLRAADTGSADISFTSGEMMATQPPPRTMLDLQWLGGLLDVILV